MAAFPVNAARSACRPYHRRAAIIAADGERIEMRVVKLVSQFANCGAGPSPHPGPEVHSLQTVNIVMRTTRASRYHGGCGRTACVARAAMERRLPAGGEARPTIWRLGGTPRPTVYTSGRATPRGKAVLDVGVKASYP